MSVRKFLLVWCTGGLENCVDITEYERKCLLADIAGTERPVFNNGYVLEAMRLRAMYNTQREYEIYIISVEDITREEIIEMFDEDPQPLVDLIRKRGVKIHSDYRPNKEKLIR